MFDPEYMKRKIEIVENGSAEARLLLARQFGYLIRGHLAVLRVLSADSDPSVNAEARSWLEQIEAMAAEIDWDGDV